MTAAPRPPEVVRRSLNEMKRRYVIYLHVDLSERRRWRRRRRPWWATITHGIFHVGEPGAGIWRARTRDELEAKCRRWIAADMLRNGDAREPIIRVEHPAFADRDATGAGTDRVER